MKIKALYIFMAIPILVLTACNDSGDMQENSGKKLAFATVDQDHISAITQFRTVVIRDISAWDQLWTEHKKNRIPQPTRPTINLSQEMIVGVFLGSRSDSCYGLSIQSISELDGKTLRVQYRESVPAPGAICAAVITNPAHLVSLPTSNLPVEFVAVQ